MGQRTQVFVYLSRKLKEFLLLVQQERDIRSRSSTINQIIEDQKQFYAPKIKEFLELEATKRGFKTNDPVTTAVDIIRDVMRGVIG